jgi:hypothetical protein
MRRIFIIIAVVLSFGFVLCVGCGNCDKNNSDLVYTVSEPQYVFGFDAQNRYAYCPSIIDNGDGTTHIYFCGAEQSQIFVDNVFHFQELADGNRTDEKSVLQPSLEWDSRHDCDPSVIEGEFKMDGVEYRYARFFLSNPMEVVIMRLA